VSFCVTQANVDDREPLKNEGFLKAIFGKLFGDKGYISEKLHQLLFVDGIQLITNSRNNMKNSLMTMSDKILLRKRSIIETVNDELNPSADGQVEHSRHRSVANFMTNLLAGIIAYNFLPKKPALKYETVKTNQFSMFLLIELRLIIFDDMEGETIVIQTEAGRKMRNPIWKRREIQK
jgi:hypothetical protein